MIVAGVMSGTSADGINVALVRVTGRGLRIRFQVLGHRQYPYPTAVRRTVLATMNARVALVADLARLDFLLGELYADAIRKTMRAFKLQRVDLVGCHGQTLYHQATPAPFLGRKVAATWQTGEGAAVAARVGAPVVSDFRPADMAAGGQGAPLVPFLDYLVFRHPRRGRIVQNLGGIANLTAIPAGASPAQVLAFDTGPGNMVIDAVMKWRFGRSYDRDGQVAARGKILEGALAELLRSPFFRQAPPKSAGREQFGWEFAAEFLRRFGRAKKEDLVATATALTACSIAEALCRFVLTPKARSRGGMRFQDYIVSGGGARNRTLMRMLESAAAELGLRLRRPEQFAIPSEAKEAVAFALLAHQTWHRRPSNIPSATGAKCAAVLGKVSYP